MVWFFETLYEDLTAKYYTNRGESGTIDLKEHFPSFSKMSHELQDIIYLDYENIISFYVDKISKLSK